MAAATDRLSALPDDLLERILSFAPAKGAASTAVLSRRWRPVWRRAGAVCLDSNLYAAAARRNSYSEPFLRDAVKLLEAFRRTGTELKSLTLFLDESAYHGAQRECFMDEKEKRREAGRGDRVGSVVLAHPAAADLEELTVLCRSMINYRYRPWLPSLPCAATLRVLELTRCDLHQPPSAAAPDLPCLTDLRLRICTITEGYLQVVVDSAPALTSLVMVHVSHKPVEDLDPRRGFLALLNGFSVRLRLRSPTVTALELEARAGEKELEPWANPGIELDMPNLRSFRYNGCPVKLSLTSPAPALARVDLDVSRRDHNVREYEPTSRMLASFSGTRALKLRLPSIEDILDGEDVMLPTFHNLELLEVNGHVVLHRHYSKYRSGDTAVAMARLLRSCPAMSELRLSFEMHMGWNYDRGNKKDPFAQSMERFNTLAPMSSTHRDAVMLGGVSDLPDAMTNNCAFSCLQKTLRKVTLKFKAMEVNCFQVQLAKFIVENAMVLQEMHVDDGDQFCSDHLYNKLATWRADSFRRRNLQETVGFRAY